jgi:hypothetical protein
MSFWTIIIEEKNKNLKVIACKHSTALLYFVVVVVESIAIWNNQEKD